MKVHIMKVRLKGPAHEAHVLGTFGKVLGYLIVAAIIVVALSTGLWILLGAALIMIIGLRAGEPRFGEERAE